MRFLADENVEKPIVDWLREAGHEVSYVAEETPSVSDSQVIKMAMDEQRVLITNDKDFGELVYRQDKVSAGVLLIRAHDQRSQGKIQLIREVLQKAGDRLKGSFAVINESGMRIRELGN